MIALKLAWPFDNRLNKNISQLARDQQGQNIARAERKKAKGELATAIADADRTWYRAHLSIYLKVYMPVFFTDAINYVDSVADAVRDGTGIDDKWFKFTVDWGIDKHNPRLELMIAQAASEHHAWCPTCTQLLPESTFYFGKGNRKGSCRKCLQEIRIIKRAKEGKIVITRAERDRHARTLTLRIQVLRQEGLTFQQIAQEVGMSETQVGKIHRKSRSLASI